MHRVVTARTGELIAQTRAPGAPHPREEHVHLIVQVATALEWATFTVGDEPEIDSAVDIIRMILAAPPRRRRYLSSRDSRRSLSTRPSVCSRGQYATT